MKKVHRSIEKRSSFFQKESIYVKIKSLKYRNKKYINILFPVFKEIFFTKIRRFCIFTGKQRFIFRKMKISPQSIKRFINSFFLKKLYRKSW